MRSIDMNANWKYRRFNGEFDTDDSGITWTRVDLPHDAMIHEKRSPRAASAHNAGWFTSADYEYVKEFNLADLTSLDTQEEYNVVLECEGVYRDAVVRLNGHEVGTRPYGYTNFYCDLTEHIDPQGSNILSITAHNSDQPNSRWYSGAGIYRPVKLWVSQRDHLILNGLSVYTVSINPTIVEISVQATAPGVAHINIPELGERVDVELQDWHDDYASGTVRLTLDNAQLWSPETPVLYTCEVSYTSEAGQVDTDSTRFGVRTLSWSDKGLLMNGQRIILDGSCVHHDNGILGACAYAEAEERKILLLKAQGYNAIRSAHNPCSKALLDACDKHGMLVMDEYIDHWYIHKTQYDYVEHFDQWWREDMRDMVLKDRNHPSVIMYSTGNEVSETAESKGIALTQELTDFLHGLDPTRPVTCGINIFFNFLSSIGLGQYSDDKAQKEAEAAQKRKGSVQGAEGIGNYDGEHSKQQQQLVGSEFFNTMAGIMGAGFMKTGATLPMCDWVTRDAFAAMDIAGYNYGINRYKHDLKKYPHRLILGSETFCSDAYAFRQLAEREPRIIGDFVWAGIDYLGETSVGAWEYRDYAPLSNQYGWLTAGSGRLDLTGTPLGEALYTRVALGKENGPYIAVVPVNHTRDKHSPSAWKMSNAIDSWSWDGYEGEAAKVEVYARAHRVELLVNGRKVGSKRLRRTCMAKFDTTYESGQIEAVSYDENGKVIGRRVLRSASSDTELRAFTENWAQGQERAQLMRTYADSRIEFIRIQYTDSAGIVKPLERGVLTAQVTGHAELLGFGSGRPYSMHDYASATSDTYYGQALAVVRVFDSPDVADDTAPALCMSDGTRSVTLSLLPLQPLA